MHRLEANKEKKENISEMQSSTTFHKGKVFTKGTSPLIDSWAQSK
jgi:hypothetical protein